MMTLAPLLCLAALASSAPQYTLHEWGTFTSVAGEDGKAIEWRPLAGPSDLPSFVYTTARPGLRNPPAQQGGKGDMRGTVRMETPVIYFYAKEPIDVSLAVTFKNGVVTEWYPWARQWSGSRLDWGTFKVVPDAKPAIPREGAPSHYYPAREVDASPVRVCGGTRAEEWERFLFYRGVGSFGLPLTVRVEGSTLELDHLDGDALVFERSGAKVGVNRVSVKGKISTSRPALTGSVEDAHRLVLEALLGSGLYEKEAKAMLETWRDSWFEDGLRVIYLVPRAMTDEVLPLQVSPAPEKSVRVLVGRFEVLTAERVETARKIALATGDASKAGRFAEPLLTRAAATAPPAEKEKLNQLIAKWAGGSRPQVVRSE